ncbi:wax ester synthase/diacylglycerol acyltransferase 11-like isoform X1 [Solanum dulcamara]|uniref:wax ester synthase/diacylglycerol acyltransferase 11-like isoform X1 n=1 Tax=Solanum dulcamara TaxID=45834 RepID=UPI0024858A7E|nr:wax ester synthase/diacylglycerol acyltransferase 11-like isoform X1 [Solanum dulcamara]
MGSLGLRPIDTMTKIGQKNSTVVVIEQEQEQEPASPATRLFHTKTLNCHIIAILGCTTKINRDVIKKGLESTLINHPRFSSVPVVDEKKGVRKWMKTTINVEEHIVCPNLDPDMDSPDEFLENYTSNLTTIPLDLTKPLWEVHILNFKTSEANAIGILKLHHSIGDGMSIISLILACTRKASDPEALPTIPSSTKKEKNDVGFFRRFCYYVWFLCMVFWYTAVDAVLFLATVLFLKDTETPMKGGAGVEHSPKRLVHVTISLDDMKIVKNALSMTINDVVMGMAQAGFSRYLNRRYGKKNGKGSSKTNNLPKNIRLRGSIVFNIRPSTGIKALAEMMEKKSKAKWGNKIGYVLTRIPISLPDNPLDYIRQAKTIIDRKKLSLESRFSFSTAKLTQDIFGSKVAAKVTRRVLSSTTVLISNVVGPQEEITFFGHKLAYVAPTTFGLPYAVTIHFQSYCNKMTISMSVDPEVIPDPYQLLDDLQDSLQMFKEVVTKQDTIGV